jgi:MFS family permease
VIRFDALRDEMRTPAKRNAPPRARRSRVAISALFFLLGAGGGTWAVRIPDIQHHLGLSTGALGVALLTVAVGSLLGMPIAGALAARLDAARLAAGCAFAFAVVLALPPLATGYAGLCGVLLLLGAASGGLGVASNAQAVLLERRLSRPMMSSFHGVLSLGALGGALSSIVIAGAGIPPVVHLPALTGALLALAILAAPHLVHAVPVDGTPTLGRPSRHVLVLGLLAFAALLCEGAVSDWSAVFLRQEAGAGPVLSGVAYVAFAGAMAAGRLAGDRLAFAWGPRRLVVGAGACATTGAIAVLAPSTPIAVGGFALLGTGLSVVFPNALAGAARRSRGQPEAAIAAVSTFGYAGFLLGPPLIGALAEASGLRTSLLILPACATVILLCARRLDSSLLATDATPSLRPRATPAARRDLTRRSSWASAVSVGFLHPDLRCRRSELSGCGP